MQLDAALDSVPARPAVPRRTAGRTANTLVFGNAEAAGVARNMLKAIAGGTEVGPILMGMGNRVQIRDPVDHGARAAQRGGLGGLGGVELRLISVHACYGHPVAVTAGGRARNRSVLRCRRSPTWSPTWCRSPRRNDPAAPGQPPRARSKPSDPRVQAMSTISMPVPDPAIIGRKAEIVAALQAALPPDAGDLRPGRDARLRMRCADRLSLPAAGGGAAAHDRGGGGGAAGLPRGGRAGGAARVGHQPRRRGAADGGLRAPRAWRG